MKSSLKYWPPLENSSARRARLTQGWPPGDGGVGDVTVDADRGDASWSIDGDLYVGFFGDGTLTGAA